MCCRHLVRVSPVTSPNVEVGEYSELGWASRMGIGFITLAVVLNLRHRVNIHSPPFDLKQIDWAQVALNLRILVDIHSPAFGVLSLIDWDWLVFIPDDDWKVFVEYLEVKRSFEYVKSARWIDGKEG